MGKATGMFVPKGGLLKSKPRYLSRFSPTFLIFFTPTSGPWAKWGFFMSRSVQLVRRSLLCFLPPIRSPIFGCRPRHIEKDLHLPSAN